jgi:hypothetical protein
MESIAEEDEMSPRSPQTYIVNTRSIENDRESEEESMIRLCYYLNCLIAS